ncbi:hemolysin [Xinfangfangia sp. D13-10-4-6]|uniref:Hint domain-containing protein n=1 Tax=Pseudogemmobacter hezensis TaxID=2737662 RepID=UPI0015559138|nr:Hint domain-containing protein [Pseudogemmobacter hezensis]NPD14243.1 hemolysin [Pseudogemmobacter hezensis]
MAITNLIVNGDFNLGSSGWSGVDMETAYTENSYLGNGSSNRVAEMDGGSGQITVMYQVVQITAPGTYPLEFRTALRNGQPLSNGEGFRIDIYDETIGLPIFSQHIYPQDQSWASFRIPITFETAGPYKVSFTELGVNNSYGAIIDDIALLVCFTAGTLIATPEGERPVEQLQAGDLVLTSDGRALPLKWIGARTITAAQQLHDGSLCPVVFEPGSLGDGMPKRRLAVSPQHRMLVSGWKAELWFGESEILVPAISLVNNGSIRQASAAEDVTYVHFLLEEHEIVLAEGAPSESFHPGDHSLQGLESDARNEVLRLFPQLHDAPPMAARPVVRRKLASLLAD